MRPLCRIESAGDHQRGWNESVGTPLHSLRRYHRPDDRQESDPPERPASTTPPYPDLWKRPVEKEEITAILTAHLTHRFRPPPHL